MAIRRRHLRSTDWRFAGWLLATGILIVLYLAPGPGVGNGAGWRRIDTPEVQRRIESGELSGREAQWYHPATSEEQRQRAKGDAGPDL